MVTAGKVIMAYFTSWSIYEPKYHVWDMDATKLSHVSYAFANIQDGLVVLGDPYADIERVFSTQGDSWSDPMDVLQGNFNQLFKLKMANRHLKVGLSIGGWTWSSQFSVIAGTELARQRFAESAVEHLLDFGLDYIDIDWEFPGGGGLPGNIVSSSDMHNFVLLLEELQTQIAQAFPDEAGDSRPFITIAASCSPHVYARYELDGLRRYVKYISMMCYDFNGAWSQRTDHQSNLYSRSRGHGSANDAVRHFIREGVAPSQLLLGVPTYARDFAQCSGFLGPFNGTSDGTWEPGLIDYKAIRSMTGYQTFWERACNATFAYNPQTRSLLSYDDHRTIAFKMDYVKKMGLGGTMFWEISADLPSNDPLSLLKTMEAWIGGEALEKTTNRVCYHGSGYRNIRNNALCPAPVKDKDTAEASEDDKMEWRAARIAQYCLSLYKRRKGGKAAGKAQGASRIAEILRQCADQFEADEADTV